MKYTLMRSISRPLLPALLFLPLAASAQNQVPDSINLVINGSFEQIEGKIKRLGSIESATGWKSPTLKSADVFSATIVNAPTSVPRTAYGEQSPLTGDNFAGIRWWSYQNKEPRTYLQMKLRKMLKKGQKYCVRYYLSLADLSKYSANEMGVYLSNMMVNRDNETSLLYNVEIPILREKIYNDPYNWQGVCGAFEAKGNEQYLLIGNFAANEKTNTQKMNRPRGETRPQVNNAYYFIDDVALFPIKLLSECSCEQLNKAESEFIYSQRGVVSKAAKPSEQLDQKVFYFKRYQRIIDAAMDPWVNETIDLMKADPTVKINLVGHTDKIEADRVNMRPDLIDLGKERAEAIKGALVEAGVEEGRITVSNKAAAEPVDRTDSEVALSKNRRVEVEIVK